MKKRILILLISLPVLLQAQWWKPSINKMDNHEHRHGLWKFYAGKGNEKYLECKGRYNHGKEKGIWYYYRPDGIRRLKYNHHRNRIRVKYFNEQGKRIEKGWARQESDSVSINYYYHGWWKYYDEKGRVIKRTEFNHGLPIEVKQSDHHGFFKRRAPHQ